MAYGTSSEEITEALAIESTSQSLTDVNTTSLTGGLKTTALADNNGKLRRTETDTSSLFPEEDKLVVETTLST